MPDEVRCLRVSSVDAVVPGDRVASGSGGGSIWLTAGTNGKTDVSSWGRGCLPPPSFPPSSLHPSLPPRGEILIFRRRERYVLCVWHGELSRSSGRRVRRAAMKRWRDASQPRSCPLAQLHDDGALLRDITSHASLISRPAACRIDFAARLTGVRSVCTTFPGTRGGLRRISWKPFWVWRGAGRPGPREDLHFFLEVFVLPVCPCGSQHLSLLGAVI